MTMNKTDFYIQYLIDTEPTKIDWLAVSNNKNISIKFIEKYFDKLDLLSIIRNKNVYPEHIEKWLTSDEIVNNIVVAKNPNLTDTFVRKYYSKDLFTNKCFYKFISVTKQELFTNLYKIADVCAFIRKYKYIGDLYEFTELNAWTKDDFWGNVGFNTNITPAFIEKYADKIYWNRIVWNPSMDKEFIERYADKIYWDDFIADTNIPFKLYKYYIDRIADYTYQFIVTLPLKYLENYKYMYNSWDNRNINSKFIDKYFKFVNWELLSDNTSLSLEILEKCDHKLCYFNLLQNSFEDAPDISVDDPVDNTENSNDITAYFVPFKRFNMIEVFQEGSKCKYYTTNVSEETWESLTKDKEYKVVLIDDGIKIELDDITIHGHKMTYD